MVLYLSNEVIAKSTKKNKTNTVISFTPVTKKDSQRKQPNYKKTSIKAFKRKNNYH